MRIWVNKFSYVPDYLNGIQTFSYLEDRVDYFIEPDEGESVADFYGNMLASVLDGSHIIISSKGNLEAIMSKIYKETGYCGEARMGDFRRSQDAVFTTNAGWIYRYLNWRNI
jgi:hypothetical protein